MDGKAIVNSDRTENWQAKVPPEILKGKNLVFDQENTNQQKLTICIGKWKKGSCTGIYTGIYIGNTAQT